MATRQQLESSSYDIVKETSPNVSSRKLTTTFFRSTDRYNPYRRKSSRSKNESSRYREEGETIIGHKKPKKGRYIDEKGLGKNDNFMFMCLDSDSPYLSNYSYIEKSDNSISPMLCQENNFFDGSKINPIEEACLVLDEKSENLVSEDEEEEDSKEVVFWLLNSAKNDFFLQNKSFDLGNESSVFDSSSMSMGSNNDFNYQIIDFNRMGSLVSSSNKNLLDFRVGFSSGEEKKDLLMQSESTLEDIPKMGDDFDDIDVDGPLFWPLDRKFDWNPNVKWEVICISPRKYKGKIIKSNGLSRSKSVRLSVHNKRKNELKVGTKKRLLRNSSSIVSTELKVKKEIVNGKLARNNSMPNSSRLSISAAEDFIKNKPIEYGENYAFFGEFKDFLVSKDEFSIEKLVGLNEFDGHEGVEEEFGVIEKLVGLNEFDGHEGVEEEFGIDYNFFLEEALIDSSIISRLSHKKRKGLQTERKRAC